MSSNVSRRSHILPISRRVHFSLHRLKYHRNALSRELRSTLVTSWIFPILDYCCQVYNDLTDELSTKLQQLTNCVIRFIFDLRRDVHISPFRRSLGWVTVRSRRLHLLGIATFNILHDCSPSYLGDLFIRSTPSVPSLISVRLPSVIHFTCLPFIFGTLFRIPYAPHPPSEYSRDVFSSTYMTSITILPWALSRLLALLHCCHYASRSL